MNTHRARILVPSISFFVLHTSEFLPFRHTFLTRTTRNKHGQKTWRWRWFLSQAPSANAVAVRRTAAIDQTRGRWRILFVRGRGEHGWSRMMWGAGSSIGHRAVDGVMESRTVVRGARTAQDRHKGLIIARVGSTRGPTRVQHRWNSSASVWSKTAITSRSVKPSRTS